MNDEDIIKALDTYFNRETPPKFVNVSRVPLICQDIIQIKNGISELKESIKTKEGDHEDRIRTLERMQYIWTGASGVIGAVGMWILEHFFKVSN